MDKSIHPENIPIFLPGVGTWLSSRYLLDGKSQDAIDLAVACGRPLLVRGLPGTGKSDLSRAAAEYLGRAFVYEVVTARTEPQDLLWRFDAIARLADAQVKRTDDNSSTDAVKPLRYVSPGPLWWALNWESAEIHVEKHNETAGQCPDKKLQMGMGEEVEQKKRAQEKGCVLLLDEIDKADSELPNSLLEVLANTGFKKPWGDDDTDTEIKPHNTAARPLIIITTNEDRELPPAFVRRCLVLNITADEDFEMWIKDRARIHFSDPDEKRDEPDNRPALKQIVLNVAAEQLMQDREKVVGDNPKPGLAEYLDLLRGLQKLAPDDHEIQLHWLKRVSQFAYKKQPVS